MSYRGEIELPASTQQVWDALHDTTVMQACMPGCEQLDWIDPQQLRGKVRVGFGPFGVVVEGHILLSNQAPPNRYTIEGRGTSGKAAGAVGRAHVSLVDRGRKTLLRYQAEADIDNISSSILAKTLDIAAGKIAATFFARLSGHLEATRPDG